MLHLQSIDSLKCQLLLTCMLELTNLCHIHGICSFYGSPCPNLAGYLRTVLDCNYPGVSNFDMLAMVDLTSSDNSFCCHAGGTLAMYTASPIALDIRLPCILLCPSESWVWLHLLWSELSHSAGGVCWLGLGTVMELLLPYRIRYSCPWNHPCPTISCFIMHPPSQSSLPIVVAH
jgi:hypothetical protein